MADAPPRTRKVTLVLTVTVLGVDSDTDPVTRAATVYRDANVYPHFQAQGFRVTKLQGMLARRHYVAPEATKPEVEYLTGVGHGAYNLFTGAYGDVIFQAGRYHPDEAAGKIVHLLSCQAARDLGPDFVVNGARAFFGYDENFVFFTAEQDVFFECDSEIDRAFADGLTAAQVYDRVTRLFDQRIADLRGAGKLREAATLEFNRDHLRCPSSGGTRWGDPRAKLA